jgi:hypothetical protein
MPDRDPYLLTGSNRLGPAALPPLSDPVRLPFGVLKASRIFAGSARSLGLLSRYRRYFVVIAFILIAIPPVVGVFGRDEAAKVLAEGRTPAAAPSIWRDGVDLPRRLDAYLKDRFGFRKEMIRLALQVDNLSSNYGNENGRVLMGRDGRMYTEQDEAVRQSAGILMRDQLVGAPLNIWSRSGTRWRNAESASWSPRRQTRRRSTRKSFRHGRATRERRPNTTCFSRSFQSEGCAPSTCGPGCAQHGPREESISDMTRTGRLAEH